MKQKLTKEQEYSLGSLVANCLTFLIVLIVGVNAIFYMMDTKKARIEWSSFLAQQEIECGIPQ